MSCESFRPSYKGGNCVASLQSFRDDGGASTAIGTKEQDTHGDY